MVALIRDTWNITPFTSAITFKSTQMTFLLASVVIDIDNCNVDNYDDVRGQTLSHSKSNSRMVLMSSSEALEPYCVKIEQLNDLSDFLVRESIDSSQLLYDNQRKGEIQVSRATDYENRVRKQCVAENAPTLTFTLVQCVNDNVINIQLPYNLDCPIEPELWDRNFHPILLHGFIKHLSSDFKNIKESLN